MALPSHETTDISSDISQLPPALAEAVTTFAKLVGDQLGGSTADMDFAEVERQTVDIVAQTGRTLLRGLIEERDDRARRIMRDGRSWHWAAVSCRKIMTLLGPVEYERTRYRRRNEQRSVSPVDDSLGLLPGSMTRPAGKLASFAVSQCTPRDAVELFDRSGGMTSSVSTLQRLMLDLHWAWQDVEPEALAEIREEEDIPQEAASFAVSLDGVMVPMRPGQDGHEEACWREAACGTLSFHDTEGERLKTIYLGRMPESGKQGLKRRIAQEAAWVWKKRPDLKMVAVADGALDNWHFLSGLLPTEEAIDFWHACEHLRTAADHAASPDDWYRRQREVLCDDPDGVARVIRAMRHLRGRARTEKDRSAMTTVIGYFCRNRRRMHYRRLRDMKLPIGSGVVEAANKTIVNQRMKCSGMRWGMTGGQAILTFRTLHRSGRFDAVWDRLMAAMGKTANDNNSPQQQTALAA